MKLLEKIILATGFNKLSYDVVENAIELASVFQSTITLVFVLPNIHRNEKERQLKHEATISHLRMIKEHINNKGVKTNESILDYGEYSDKIVQVAERMTANMIIVGSSEESKNKIQLSKTTKNIIKKSNKPVWVVKNGIQLNLKTILCPVDFSNESKRALKNAVVLARKFKARLIVFSVFNILIKGSIKINKNYINKLREVDHKKELTNFLQDYNLQEVHYTIKIIGGNPTLEILEAIKNYNIDLLIMGTSGKTGLSRMIIGSVTEKVTKKVPCSFITLKSENLIDFNNNKTNLK